MAAIIPDPGWGNSHQDPPSTIPGPSNPWAMCTDTGNNPLPSDDLGESPLPLMGDPAWPVYPCSDGLWFIGVGLTITGMMTIGAVAVGTLIFGAEIIGSGLVAGWFMALGAFGFLSTGAGVTAMLSSFDPIVFDHTQMVPVPPRRSLRFPDAMPQPLRDLVTAGSELEFLNNGGFDVRDHARAAAAASDATAYDQHLQNLFLIEDNMQAQVNAAADLLEQMADHPDLKLDQVPVDPDMPIRDLVNPAAKWRIPAMRMGLDSAHVTQSVGLMRADPLVDRYLRPTMTYLLDKHGHTAKGMLLGAAEMLRARAMIEWDAFGGKPA